MKILCESCDVGVKSVDSWLGHLQSPGHQIAAVTTLQKWETEAEERAVLVKLLTGNRASAADCLDYFAYFGFVSDFVICGDLKSIIILFDVEIGSDYLLRGRHFIDKDKEIPVDVQTFSTVKFADRAGIYETPPPYPSNLSNGIKNVGHSTVPPKGSSNSTGNDFIEQRMDVKPFSQPIGGGCEVLASANDNVLVVGKDEGRSKFSQKQPASESQSKELKQKDMKPKEQSGPKLTEPKRPNPVELKPNEPEKKLKELQSKQPKRNGPEPKESNKKSSSNHKLQGAKQIRNEGGNPPTNPKQSGQDGNQRGKYVGPEKLAYQRKKSNFLNAHNKLTSTLSDSSVDLQQQLTIFLESVSMAKADLQKREDFLENLRGMLKKDFPSSLLYPFGSYLTKLGDSDSDMDIFIDVKGTSATGNDESGKESSLSFLHSIKTCLYRSISFSHIRPVTSARIPILKVIHGLSGVHADLSFTNLISFQNSNLVAFYIKFDPRVGPLLLLTRYWARFHELTGSNQLKSYGLVLLVLVFLMKKGIIPSVHFLQEKHAATAMEIGNWNAGFCDDMELVKASGSFPNCESQKSAEDSSKIPYLEILNLAQAFFQTFATLDFQKVVISTLTGDFITRELFASETLSELPEEFHRYKNVFAAGEKGGLDIKSPVCIQDPFELSFNVGGCIKNHIFTKFKEACTVAAAQLEKVLVEEAPKLMSIFVAPPKKPKKGYKFGRKRRLYIRDLDPAAVVPTNKTSITSNTKE